MITPSEKCFLFDIDGTLTEARQPMEPKFAAFFEKWASEHTVYLVSGSDLPKIKKQISINILNKCEGIFSCMGNELWKSHHNLKWLWSVYKNKLNIPEEVTKWLQIKLKESKFKGRTHTHFEHRSGMLNFSIAGRGEINPCADRQLRDRYREWDASVGERAAIVQEFNNTFSHLNLEALVGGQISLDIQEKGKDKGQILQHIKHDHYVFFGDKCEAGGNDHSLYKKVDEGWCVKNYIDTRNILCLKYF